MVTYQRYMVFACVALITLFAVTGALRYSAWFLPVVAISGALANWGFTIFCSAGTPFCATIRSSAVCAGSFGRFRPEIRQYLIEDDTDQTPFSRSQRSLVYARAKGDETSDRAFGTLIDVYENGYEFIADSTVPRRSPIRRRFRDPHRRRRLRAAL